MAQIFGEQIRNLWNNNKLESDNQKISNDASTMCQNTSHTALSQESSNLVVKDRTTNVLQDLPSPKESLDEVELDQTARSTHTLSVTQNGCR